MIFINKDAVNILLIYIHAPLFKHISITCSTNDHYFSEVCNAGCFRQFVN
jgi:hypothetical protein